jgi:tripartite-type tricarboxylate transporter receptor subunit TctC
MTRDTIAPTLIATYGKGSMVDALARHLAEKIDRCDWDSRGREHMVMATCWDWFPGGGTAAAVAAKIEATAPRLAADEVER